MILALPYYEEKWIIPEGFSMYEISNMGNGKSNRQRKDFLKPLVNKDGYLFFILIGDDGKRHTCYIHRLVAEAFIPNPDNLPTVDHINRVRNDNRAENLRWADMKLQSKNSIHLNRESAKEACSKPVLQYTLDGVFVAEYPSTLEAQRQTGVCHVSITQCCKKQKYRHTAGGYIWRYKD